MQYLAVDIGRKDRFVVVGRDLRQLAVMQQRLISAQQSMERDYARLRQAETRYRLLFQVASEAVLIVDGAGHAIVDANPAALALFDASAPQLLKSRFVDHFDPSDLQTIERLFADIRSGGATARHAFASRAPKAIAHCRRRFSGRTTRRCFW